MINQQPEQEKIFYGVWIVVACFVLLFLFAGAGFYSFSIFIKSFENEFGWNRASVSLALSIYMIVHGICGPFVGYLTEKYGPQKVMTVFAVGSGATFILVSFTQNLLYFYLIYAILSIFTAGIGFIPVSSLLAKWYARRWGTAIGVSMVGLAVGGFIMSPLVGYINEQYSWRIAYVVMGFMVWGMALPVTIFFIKGSPAELGLLPDGDPPIGNYEPSEDKESSPSTEGEGWSLSEAIKTRTFWWIMATYFLAPLAQGSILQHQVPLVLEAGIAPTAAAWAMGITAGMGGLGKLGFGRISESLPFHYVAALCFGLQILAIGFLLVIKSPELVWVYVFLFGFAMGGVVVLMPVLVRHFFGLASFGTIMGTVSFVQGFGQATGGYISGLMFDYFGNYNPTLIMAGSIYVIAIITIFLAGRPKAYTA